MARARKIQSRIPSWYEIVTARVDEELKGFSDAYTVRDRMLREERNRQRKKAGRKRKAS